MSHLLDVIEACDGDVRSFAFVGEDLAGLALGHVEFEDCRFDSCSFAGLHADRISFDRCTFASCDFSNAQLPVSFWRDVSVRESRLVGTNLTKSVLTRARFEDCAAAFLNLAESKTDQLTLRRCDLREASLSQLRVKRLHLEDCDLTRAEVFRTRLRGVDLSTCSISGLRASDTFAELRGCKLGLDQAPDVLAMLDIKLV